MPPPPPPQPQPQPQPLERRMLDNVCRMLCDRAYEIVWRDDDDADDAADDADDTGPAATTASLRNDDHRELLESRVVAKAAAAPSGSGPVSVPVSVPVLVIVAVDPRQTKMRTAPPSEAMATAAQHRSSWSPGIGYIRALLKWMRANDYAHTVLVLDDHPTSIVVNAVAKECSDGVRIELFRKCEFNFHTPSHSLVPRHTALTVDEAAVFLKTRYCERKDLEILLTTDPIARWYAYDVGTLVRIDRRYGNGLVSPTVRVVKKP